MYGAYMIMRMIDRPTVLWTLRRAHDWLECSVQVMPRGLQLHMSINRRTPYFSRVFQTQDELLTWAAQERARCEAEKWS